MTQQQTLAPYLRRRPGEFSFPLTEKVIFGPGTIERLSDEIERLDCRRVFVLTGNSIATKTPLLARVEEILGSTFAGAYTGIRQHAPSQTVLEAARRAETAHADVVIGLGGGSPIDAARACARMLAQATPPSGIPDGEFFTYLSQPMVKEPIPNLSISTTLSAADFSAGGGITDEVNRTKFVGYGDPRLTTKIIFLDPEVTLYTPAELWSASGMRAIDHAVESLYSRLPHPVTDLIATRALNLLFTYLPACLEEPKDVESRGQCQLGCWFSFFSPPSVMLGPSHALGHQLGSRCDVPHGVTSCIFLPAVMRFLAPALAERMVPIAAALGVDTQSRTAEESALAAADAVAALVERLGLPSRLRDVGVTEADLEPIAQAAFAEGGMQGTARAISSADELMGILHDAW